MTSLELLRLRMGSTRSWREFHGPLADNYQLSVNRLQGLLCWLKQDPAILKEYDNIIQDQLRSGIIEVVPASKSPKATYLPHYGVVHQDSHNKGACSQEY